MGSKAVFSTLSDSWTSETEVSFIKTGTHVTLLHFADWWWSMVHCFGKNTVRKSIQLQQNVYLQPLP
jgi:hypothetical protein